MSTNAEASTATILPFPIARRFAGRREAYAEPPRPVIVESGAGAWYHEEAIREADRRGRA